MFSSPLVTMALGAAAFLCVSTLITTTTAAAAAATSQPNIIFLLTDDQDVSLGGLTPMKNLMKLVAERGITFNNAFVHTPICCPSRSSYLSGKYLHNGGALNNTVQGNCAGEDWVNRNEQHTFAVNAHNAGYVTHYSGKYLNQYAIPGSPGCEKHGDAGCYKVPPGYSNWLGLCGNSKYYNYDVSDNGTLVHYGNDYATDYFPDIVANSTLKFIYDSAKEQPGKPILAVNAWPSPHGPHPPAPQFAHTYDGFQAPITPNYNESAETIKNKHWLVRHQDIITPGEAKGIDTNFEQRWETLLSVDQHVAQIVQALIDTGRYDNTYIIYTSDHGFQLGQHRLLGDKRHLYENDIRIPFIVSGPGVPQNVTSDAVVLNVDVAPTITELATGQKPEYMDGQSFASILKGGEGPQRTDFLIDYHGQKGPCGLYQCPPPTENFHEIDGGNNTYTCVRTLSMQESSIYCEFVDDEDFKEYYDIRADPWQLNNAVNELPKDKLTQLQQRLSALRECDGPSCHTV